MTLSSCKLLPAQNQLLFEYPTMLIRIDKITLVAKWDDTESFGAIHLTKAEVEELVAGSSSNNREFITTSILNSWILLRVIRS